MLIIGNEGNGVREEIKKYKNHFIKLNMNKNCESLNAGVAASILMYEINEAENDLTLQSEKKETTEKNPDSILRNYFVEYIEEDSELFQANCIYGLIEKILKQEGEFTPFVEKCYRSFTKSSIPELIQFYNLFSEYTIKKISEFDSLTVVYEKE